MAFRPLLGLTLVSLALAAVSCGTPPPPVARESASISETLPPVDEATTLPPATELRLSVDEALLQGDDAPAPWDMRNRNVEAFAHDIGPNQTDCDPYWEYERIGRLEGGETMWWREGGNLNNMVRREGQPGQAAALMRVFADLPQTCGVTSWSEGDSFTIEPLDLSDVPGTDGIVALSIDHVRTDEVLWLAFAQRADLISELRVTMWPESESGRIPSFSRVDFATVAATMSERLALAGEHVAAPPTTSTVPGERPDEITPTLPTEWLDEVPEFEPLPPQLTIPPIDVSPTTSDPLEPLAAALLLPDELPDGWTAERAEVYDDGDGDGGDDALAGCPESSIIVELDRRFEYSTELSTVEATTWQSDGMQFIAALSGGGDGAEIINSFLGLDGCEGSDEYARYLLAAAAVEVRGADASVLVHVDQTVTADPTGDTNGEPETQRYVLALATVGTTLTAFSLPAEAPERDFLQRAVDKILATGPS